MAFGIFEFGLFGKHKCEICGKETKDLLYIDKDEKWLCRMHLIENFAKIFLVYPDKMVIFHPEFEKVCKQLYSFYPSKDLGWFSFNKESIAKTKELLDFMKGNCSECQKEATVLYFPKGFLDYSGSTPHIEKAHPSSGQLLCATHAFEKIRADLQLNPGAFEEGLYAPYSKTGLYVSTYL